MFACFVSQKRQKTRRMPQHSPQNRCKGRVCVVTVWSTGVLRGSRGPAHAFDRPRRLKHWAIPLACRRGCSGAIRQQQQKSVLFFLCHLGHEQPNPGCCIVLLSTVPKIRYATSDRKTNPETPGKTNTEHNQRPRTDTAKRRFALIPIRRKTSDWPLGRWGLNPSLL